MKKVNLYTEDRVASVFYWNSLKSYYSGQSYSRHSNKSINESINNSNSSQSNRNSYKVHWICKQIMIAGTETSFQLMLEWVDGWCWNMSDNCIPDHSGGNWKSSTTNRWQLERWNKKM